ncbi:4-phosphoerythronate dehydrogenase [Salinibius halmophilus]|uniref:4-phosphoerythronate dehydrogenase n=1 Tax=Salinibius halmophilus TaxID=1853216 RepID=UPI000E66BFB2|nr:4-phosphoerythronate dehydrogenase [Salinibius halmophilus]
MHIVADENMPWVNECFGQVASRITRLPGRSLSKADLQDADMLLVRSVTQVNEALLSGTPVKAVGSATIGVDHIDQAYLAQQGIRFANSPGCNAAGVVDWVFSCLNTLWREQKLPWLEKTFAVVGCGNVGGRLISRLRALGCQVLTVDPLRTDIDHTPLNDALQAADIVCLHTPLTKTGEHATAGMITADKLALLKPDAVLINAGRGQVISPDALAVDRQILLDVWPQEPNICDAWLRKASIATPHIAGYSFEGKIRGTSMLAEQLLEGFAGIAPPPAALASISLQTGLSVYQAFDAAIRAVYDVRSDDARFRQRMWATSERAQAFDWLRKHYPERKEFASLTVYCPEHSEKLCALGFTGVA